MLLMHVTKDNKCSFCGAGVVKCKEVKCQQFFNPRSTRHVYHADSCKMRDSRRRNCRETVSEISRIRDELELDDE